MPVKIDESLCSKWIAGVVKLLLNKTKMLKSLRREARLGFREL